MSSKWGKNTLCPLQKPKFGTAKFYANGAAGNSMSRKETPTRIGIIYNLVHVSIFLSDYRASCVEPLVGYCLQTFTSAAPTVSLMYRYIVVGVPGRHKHHAISQLTCSDANIEGRR